MESVAIYNNLDLARKEAEEIKSHIKYLGKDEQALKDRVEELTKQVEDKNNQLLDKINEIAPHIHAVLRGNRTKKDLTNLTLLPQGFSVLNELPQEYLDGDDALIDFGSDLCIYLSKKFEEEGRNYNPLFVANLLVAFQNSFLTFIHGSPGTGKTSVIKILQKLLNMHNFFIEVNVAKGWDSERDWIGFYNALQDEFTPSRTGVYNYLKSIDSEEGPIASPWILLDEANLSTMEHYWSQFNGMADSESNRSLMIDGGGSIDVDEQFRFIGTINNDHTTKPLSERIVSRACIVTIEKGFDTLYDIDSELDTDTFEEIMSKHALSSEVMKSCFCSEKSDQSGEVLAQLEEFVSTINSVKSEDDHFREGVEFSNRTVHKISEYANSALPIFSKIISKSSSSNRAVDIVSDYVISQFLLPNIRLTGSVGGEQLLMAAGLCEERGYEISSRLIRTILADGLENLDQYGMFNN